MTALRVGLCVALAAFAGWYTPPFGKLATLAVAPLLGAAYIGLLVTTRELGKAEKSVNLAPRTITPLAIGERRTFIKTGEGPPVPKPAITTGTPTAPVPPSKDED